MVKKKEFIWNAIASGISSLLNAILLLICTRINGTEVAGIFSIAFATSVIFNSVGEFGIRVFQVTDIKRKYSFNDYLTFRFGTTTIMLISTIIFTIISKYDLFKATICIALILFRYVDNISETYQGEMQLNGRLDLAGKSVVLRYVLSITAFAIANIITKNIIIASIVLFIINLIVFILFDLKVIKEFINEKVKFSNKKIKNMLKECIPVFISTILTMYLANAAKYAIDKYCTYDIQTYFNIIYLPAFTINLLSTLITKPLLKQMSELWNDNKILDFIKFIIKVVLIILALTLVIAIVCYAIGIPILSLIYGVDLSNYRMDLIILIFSGGLFALCVLFFYTLTTTRSQYGCTIAYVISSIFAYFISDYLVKQGGLRGATVSNVVINATLLIILIILLAFNMKNVNKNGNIM